MAANHWQRAIDTHQADFPQVDHVLDVAQHGEHRPSGEARKPLELAGCGDAGQRGR